jgi:5'-phosphate synthase pdxT subunit
MVEVKSIGVLGIQGDVSEHILSLEKALDKINKSALIKSVNNRKDLEKLDALIIPGGESTTISKILHQNRLYDLIKLRIKNQDLAIMGTCAGCVILADGVLDKPKDLLTLKAMDMIVERNAFGRQRESFEGKLHIKDFSFPFNAVFIRAPIINKIWNGCEVMASFEGKIVMARQDNFLAITFHPELTGDTRIHEYFLNLIF